MQSWATVSGPRWTVRMAGFERLAARLEAVPKPDGPVSSASGATGT